MPFTNCERQTPPEVLLQPLPHTLSWLFIFPEALNWVWWVLNTEWKSSFTYKTTKSGKSPLVPLFLPPLLCSRCWVRAARRWAAKTATLIRFFAQLNVRMNKSNAAAAVDDVDMSVMASVKIVPDCCFLVLREIK